MTLPEQDPVVVEPLPFDEEAAMPFQQAVQQMIDTEAVKKHAHNLILTMLDEIDAASSIPHADTRVRLLTKRIRDTLKGV